MSLKDGGSGSDRCHRVDAHTGGKDREALKHWLSPKISLYLGYMGKAPSTVGRGYLPSVNSSNQHPHRPTERWCFTTDPRSNPVDSHDLTLLKLLFVKLHSFSLETMRLLEYFNKHFRNSRVSF